MSKCERRQGTYVCIRPEGHTGDHRTAVKRERHHDNSLKANVWRTFNNDYVAEIVTHRQVVSSKPRTPGYSAA